MNFNDFSTWWIVSYRWKSVENWLSWKFNVDLTSFQRLTLIFAHWIPSKLNENLQKHLFLYQIWALIASLSRWFNFDSTLKMNLKILVDLQRWINVEDQPNFSWKFQLILNVDSTLNQRWRSTFFFLKIVVEHQRWFNVESTLKINQKLINGWNLVEFWFSWSVVEDQRWFNVERQPCARWVTSRFRNLSNILVLGWIRLYQCLITSVMFVAPHFYLWDVLAPFALT